MSVFDQLDREWAWIARHVPSPPALSSALDAGGAGTLDELHTFVKAASPDRADAVLAELARLATRDDLAARALLQMLLPGARRLATRWWAVGDPDERAAASVSAVYGRIRSYPFERRPHRIAANVLLDATVELRRIAQRRLASSAVLPLPDTTIPQSPPERHAAEELASLLADAVRSGIISRPDAELVALTRIEGRRLADLAETRGAPLRTLQGRRRRAEAALIEAGSAA
jgi:DNA-directed RNA polymerase specialized sigma24 family protein